MSLGKQESQQRMDLIEMEIEIDFFDFFIVNQTGQVTREAESNPPDMSHNRAETVNMQLSMLALQVSLVLVHLWATSGSCTRLKHVLG